MEAFYLRRARIMGWRSLLLPVCVSLGQQNSSFLELISDFFLIRHKPPSHLSHGNANSLGRWRRCRFRSGYVHSTRAYPSTRTAVCAGPLTNDDPVPSHCHLAKDKGWLGSLARRRSRGGVAHMAGEMGTAAATQERVRLERPNVPAVPLPNH